VRKHTFYYVKCLLYENLIEQDIALNIFCSTVLLCVRVHGSIPTEGKNSTREGGGEDREVVVSGPPKMVRSGLLHNSTQITAKEYF
jgi:hypothetical protein